MEVEEAISKLEQTLWTTKSTVSRKLKKTEETLIAPGDLELDTRLELFSSINETTTDLELIIKFYKERVCLLASEEAALANFLRDVSKADKAGASKALSTAAKAMAHVAQQRAALRHPVMRMFQEIITFRKRAISDCAMTVSVCEKRRDDYKGTLLWMANVSQKLDPDASRQMNKFRKVQRQVKESKTSYDQIKLVSMQKIDLLAAARSNLFSHSISNYQKVLAEFLRVSTITLESAAERLKEPVQFRFTILKELDTLESFSAEAGEETAAPKGEEKLLFDFEFKDENLQSPAPVAVNPSINLARKDSEDLIDTSQLLADLTEELKDLNIPVTKTANNDLVDLGLADFDIFGKSEMSPSQEATGLFIPLLLDGAPSEFVQMFDFMSVSDNLPSSGQNSATRKSDKLKLRDVSGSRSLSDALGSRSLSDGPEKKGAKDWFDLFSELDPLGKHKASQGDC